MSGGCPTRRAVIGALAAATVSGGQARAQTGPTGFGSVGVDVRPLRAKGLGEYADVVGSALQAELASAFADRMAPGGPRLIVRIDAISMRSYAGSESRFLSSGSPTDYLEGEALVVDRRGGVIRRHPQLSAVPASSGGAWYLPDAENRRVVALAQHYAGWLRRAL